MRFLSLVFIVTELFSLDELIKSLFYFCFFNCESNILSSWGWWSKL